MPENVEVTLCPNGSGKDVQIAERFGITVATARDTSAWQLVRSMGSMTLCAPLEEGGYSIRVDVAQGPMARRIRTARRTDPLPRAVGLNRRRTVSVVDATAGLGRDAMVLAHLGCTVIALERVPALCALLQLAIDDLGAKIEVEKAESTDWLANISAEQAPDVVYLDPMFSDPGRSQVKKEMQACRALAHETQDEAALLAVARLVAKDRVVVKRHPNNDPIAADVSHAVSSERVRFDVYVKKQDASTEHGSPENGKP